MMRTHIQVSSLVFAPGIALGLAPQLRAQDTEENRGFSIGMHFTGLQFDRLGEGAAGLGLRAAYDFPLKNTLIVSPEVEFNHFPANPSGNFGETQLLAGAKIGLRRDQIGVFAKVRPGFIHIPGNGDFAERNGGAADKFALDTGVVLEYRPRRRVALRFDLGDTMVYFASPVNTGVGAPRPAGMSHNMQFAMGMVFHF